MVLWSGTPKSKSLDHKNPISKTAKPNLIFFQDPKQIRYFPNQLKINISHPWDSRKMYHEEYKITLVGKLRAKIIPKQQIVS